MDKAKMMKAERNNWTKIYHKTLKGLEAMIDMQKQIKDMLKIVAETNTVKNKESGLNIFYFLSSFLFILFLELGLGLEWQDHAVTQQVTSDNTWKDIEYSGRDNVIQYVIHMLTLRHTHGCLG